MPTSRPVHLLGPLLVLLLLTTACGGGSERTASDDQPVEATEQPAPATTPEASTTTEPEPRPEVVVVAECDERTSDPLSLSALDAETGEVVATIETGLAEARRDPRQPFSSGICDRGNGFSPDLSRVAGYTTIGGFDQRAAWFDLTTGTMVLPSSPKPDATDQLGGYFVGDDYWYYEATALGRTIFRVQGDSPAEEIGTCAWENSIPGSMPPDLLPAAAPFCMDGHTERSLVADDGQRTIIGSQYIDRTTGLPGTSLEVSSPAGSDDEGCAPYRWISETELLCRQGAVATLSGSSISLSRLAPTLAAGTTIQTPLRSPDGQMITFIGCDGTCDLYQISANPDILPIFRTGWPLPEYGDAVLVAWFEELPAWMAEA